MKSGNFKEKCDFYGSLVAFRLRLFTAYLLRVNLICRWAKIYFVAWWLISSVIWVNLFVALLLEVRKCVCLFGIVSWKWVLIYVGNEKNPDNLFWKKYWLCVYFIFLLPFLPLRCWGSVFFFLNSCIIYSQHHHRSGRISLCVFICHYSSFSVKMKNF